MSDVSGTVGEHAFELPEADEQDEFETVLQGEVLPAADEPVPTPGEVLAEAAELGVMLAEAWWRTLGKAAEVGLVEPARVFARLIGPATSRMGESRLAEAALPAAAQAPRLVGAAARGSVGSYVADRGSSHRDSLKERGAELLRRSADVDYEEEQHPAFRRILDELTPDEARILRLLANEGAQPVVDVRSGVLGLGHVVAGPLAMVGAAAGCRYTERFQAYLDNLSRLGLVAVSDEPVGDPQRYQLLEAQPDVVAALSEAGRFGHTTRRSLVLTPFGHDFCEHCLPAPGEAVT
jgi:hypothetical protein